MNSTITQVLASILILFSLTKLVVVLVNPRAWIGFAKRLYANPEVTKLGALLVAGIILGLVLRSGLDIVQILAVCLFVVSLIVVGVAPYAPQLFAWVEKEDVEQLIKRQWLYVSVWIALLLWGLYTLLA